MDDRGYIYHEQDEKTLKKRMKELTNPKVPTREEKEEFLNQLRKRMQRRDKFKKY